LKVTYTIPIKQDAIPEWKDNLSPLLIDNKEITWNISKDGQLESLSISVTNQKIQTNDGGIIDSHYDHLLPQIFKVANYLSSRVYIQTMHDCLNPFDIFNSSPHLSPETEKEREIFAHSARSVFVNASLGCKIHNFLDPNQYVEDYCNSQVYSFIADAKRTSNPFICYEQYYKVLEYFFPGKKEDFDDRVSNHAESLNAKYDIGKIKYFRNLRNRSVHAQARLGHLNPEDLKAVAEVKNALQDLQRLVMLLIANPPGAKDDGRSNA